MSICARVLVILGITLSACVNVNAREDEGSRSPDADSQPSRASNSRGRGLSDAGSLVMDSGGSRAWLDAGTGLNEPLRGRTLAGGDESDADIDPDADGGVSELEEAILLDCTETVSCDGSQSRLDSCVPATTQALAGASPQARQRFLAIVMQCSELRDCDYVRCVQMTP